jgi:Tat protein secretion system quality control protein TatD with DNase activity
MAKVKGVTAEELAAITTANAERVFPRMATFAKTAPAA